MKIETRIAEFKDQLKVISKAPWRDADDHIKSLIENLDEKTFDEIVFSSGVWESAIEESGVNHWTLGRILRPMILKHRCRADDVLKNSSIDQLKEIILSNGLYTNVSVLDHVATTSSGDTQFVAAQFCSTSALRNLVTCDNTKVRKIVFQRLGPVECLDLMLSDTVSYTHLTLPTNREV